MVLEKIYIEQKPLQPPKPPSKDWFRIILLVFAVFALIFAALYFSEVVEKDEHGNYRLKSERKEKFEADSLKMTEECQQYALVAKVSGIYPCFSCPDRDSIFLNEGEIWKYGVTCNGEKRRYGNKMPTQDLVYLPQYTGSLLECSIMETRKIIEYPLLPENLNRKPADRLARPAGNPYDK
ncbi:MAG: hypothetical protein EAZ97_01570 [Bacteroidetes bacterium]|nr:MAG: hypothetical protein EAZ97_01570 [Bacteroidota bacterium]